ncbi:MAG: hypothetical protein IID53_10790 [Proteobacteria bacterium]|nr:hypothetical protein [Pseudomonadota bacterium]
MSETRPRSGVAGLFRLCLAPALALFSVAASAAGTGFDFSGLKLPPGFTATPYISATGFDPGQGAPGLPAIVTITFDSGGNLYFARTANRLREIYGSDSAPIYRLPVGPAKITPDRESEILFGPALPDPDEAAVNEEGEVFVSTSDREKGFGSVYKLSPSGKARLFAGGPPAPGSPPLFIDPEGIAFDASGHVYVADDDLGVVVKLDRRGKVLNPRFISGPERFRTLTYDPSGFLWVGSDGRFDAPHADGSGRIYRASLADGKLRLLHSGPLASGMSLSPGGNLFAAQRRSGKIFALTPEGKRVEFATFGRQADTRTLAFPPDTEATRKAGIAGDLFVMVFPMLDYPVREIIRISGPFDEYVKRQQ